jgi:peptidoglycan/xylan/chitin deacetylase (PgdA/CDA1 family)
VVSGVSGEPADLADRVAAAAQANERRYQLLEKIDYPEGIRMAVNFTCDFDAMLLRRLLNEPVPQRAQGEFGGRVGIWRLIELFDAHDVKATIFTPGRICELYPDSLRAAHASGHEIADHMWEHQVPKDAELERDHLFRSTEALEAAVGRRPVGTRSGFSKALLEEAGYLYDSHGSANPAQRITEPGRVMALWWDAFEQQYEVGGYLNICLHPFVSGRALRIAMLGELIARMKAKPGVWFPTCHDVAAHITERHPLIRRRD